MSDETWIVVPNWERFQHYRDREPTWIKVYTELAHRDQWRRMTLSERGLLVSIWIEYALSRGQLRSSDLPSAVTQKVPRRSLDSLLQAGWVEVSASAPTRARARTRSLEKEEEKSKNPPTPRRRGAGNQAEKSRRKAERWIKNGAAAEVPMARLSEVIADEFGISDPATVADLTALASERTP